MSTKAQTLPPGWEWVSGLWDESEAEDAPLAWLRSPESMEMFDAIGHRPEDFKGLRGIARDHERGGIVVWFNDGELFWPGV